MKTKNKNGITRVELINALLRGLESGGKMEDIIFLDTIKEFGKELKEIYDIDNEILLVNFC